MRDSSNRKPSKIRQRDLDSVNRDERSAPRYDRSGVTRVKCGGGWRVIRKGSNNDRSE